MAEFTTLRDCFSSNGELVANTPATVSATTTSAAFFVGDRTELSVQIGCSGHTSGNGKFEVLISNDGTNFNTFQRIVADAAVTAGSTPALVNQVTLSANGYDYLLFPNGDHFAWMKVRCTVTTDGAYSAVIHAV